MCGISGIVSLKNKREDLWERVILMNDTIANRGPDDWGIYTNIACSDNPKIEFSDQRHLPDFCLGHRRLSILDLSPAGRQPMVATDCENVIILNGEIYNYIELRQELSAYYKFYTTTDTEVLQKAYHKWGEQVFQKLDGMFAFVLLDLKKGELIAGRDSMGIKPFYYHLSNDVFIFGSEPKTVLKGLGINGHLDWERASEMLIVGVMDHDNGTLYREVQQLEGGHFLKLNLLNGSSEKVEYRKQPEVLKTVDFNAAEEYLKVARLAITRQLRSDVTVGSSLSGGIDSGTIVSLAGEILGDKAANYKTLTFSFPGHKNDESETAKQIATHAGMEWHSIIPSLDTLEDGLEKMTINMGEPFSTLSMFAQYKVMEYASEQGIKVMLDGQGGDEVYLGYPRIAERVMMDYLVQGNISKFLEEWEGLERHLSIPKLSSILGNFYFNSRKIAIPRRLSRIKAFIKPDLMHAYRKDVAADFYASKNVYDKQWDELVKYCLPRLLRFADRNSMAFGVEQRVPHLGKPILDFALQLPMQYRVNNGWTKYNVRKAMTGKIPDNVLWDTVKRGFDVPQSMWVSKLSNKIEQWVGALPNDAPINKDAIISTLRKPTSGTYFFWPVVSLANFIHLSNVEI